MTTTTVTATAADPVAVLRRMQDLTLSSVLGARAVEVREDVSGRFVASIDCGIRGRVSVGDLDPRVLDELDSLARALDPAARQTRSAVRRCGPDLIMVSVRTAPDHGACMEVFDAAGVVVAGRPELANAHRRLAARLLARELGVGHSALRVRFVDGVCVPETWAAEPHPAREETWQPVAEPRVGELCSAFASVGALPGLPVRHGDGSVSFVVRTDVVLDDAPDDLDLLARAWEAVLSGAEAVADGLVEAALTDLGHLLRGDVGDRVVPGRYALLRDGVLVGVWPCRHRRTEHHPPLELAVTAESARALAVLRRVLAGMDTASATWRDRVLPTFDAATMAVRMDIGWQPPLR